MHFLFQHRVCVVLTKSAVFHCHSRRRRSRQEGLSLQATGLHPHHCHWRSEAEDPPHEREIASFFSSMDYPHNLKALKFSVRERIDRPAWSPRPFTSRQFACRSQICSFTSRCSFLSIQRAWRNQWTIGSLWTWRLSILFDLWLWSLLRDASTTVAPIQKILNCFKKTCLVNIDNSDTKPDNHYTSKAVLRALNKVQRFELHADLIDAHTEKVNSL